MSSQVGQAKLMGEPSRVGLKVESSWPGSKVESS